MQAQCSWQLIQHEPDNPSQPKLKESAEAAVKRRDASEKKNNWQTAFQPGANLYVQEDFRESMQKSGLRQWKFRRQEAECRNGAKRWKQEDSRDTV